MVCVVELQMKEDYRKKFSEEIDGVIRYIGCGRRVTVVIRVRHQFRAARRDRTPGLSAGCAGG